MLFFLETNPKSAKIYLLAFSVSVIVKAFLLIVLIVTVSRIQGEQKREQFSA